MSEPGRPIPNRAPSWRRSAQVSSTKLYQHYIAPIGRSATIRSLTSLQDSHQLLKPAEILGFLSGAISVAP